MKKSILFSTSPFMQNRSIEDKLFYLSLVASLLMHIFLFVCLFLSNVHYGRKIPRPIEVVYQTEARKAAPPKKAPQVTTIRKKKLKTNPKVLSKKNSSYAPVVEGFSKQPLELKEHSKPSTRIYSDQVKRHISIPMLQSEKITNPKYISYHERIRNKIRDRAYFYADDPDFEEGEVYLTFVISDDGALKQVKILSDKTHANDYLKNVGLRSIKESAPFPAFPKDLQYPELSFNVIISFKVEK